MEDYGMALITVTDPILLFIGVFIAAAVGMFALGLLVDLLNRF